MVPGKDLGQGEPVRAAEDREVMEWQSSWEERDDYSTLCRVLCPPCRQCEEKGRACVVVDVATKSTCAGCSASKLRCERRSVYDFAEVKTQALLARQDDLLASWKAAAGKWKAKAEALERKVRESGK